MNSKQIADILDLPLEFVEKVIKEANSEKNKKMEKQKKTLLLAGFSFFDKFRIFYFLITARA